MILKTFLLMSALFLFNFSAHGFQDISESAELIPQGSQHIGFSPQFKVNRGGGSNIAVFVEAGTSESTSTRVTLEGGDVNFNVFTSFKYVPFPDVDQQPAIGIRGGIGVARSDDSNNLYFQGAPMVSKMMLTEVGTFIPFVAIPFEYNSTKESNYTSNRFVIGSEFRTEEAPDARFGTELGLELNKSFSYISFFFTYPIK